ncbi:uncharacterized protein B0H18DRAFT_44182 [Fomitopsis serialis]|uniref:uncharacterized protein n=1 Tax=Fomitopsis serialis TaxID=139415 RepID=UPI00200835D4|nr:uncharacterized protein B0H18DRAFT_44182 [Neoantrodia serialis]KAH9917057.1 hypothetical protein B0H18DRAFT_44182 [Neoantrodia serialis]
MGKACDSWMCFSRRTYSMALAPISSLRFLDLLVEVDTVPYCYSRYDYVHSFSARLDCGVFGFHVSQQFVTAAQSRRICTERRGPVSTAGRGYDKYSRDQRSSCSQYVYSYQLLPALTFALEVPGARTSAVYSLRDLDVFPDHIHDRIKFVVVQNSANLQIRRRTDARHWVRILALQFGLRVHQDDRERIASLLGRQASTVGASSPLTKSLPACMPGMK